MALHPYENQNLQVILPHLWYFLLIYDILSLLVSFSHYLRHHMLFFLIMYDFFLINCYIYPFVICLIICDIFSSFVILWYYLWYFLICDSVSLYFVIVLFQIIIYLWFNSIFVIFSPYLWYPFITRVIFSLFASLYAILPHYVWFFLINLYFNSLKYIWEYGGQQLGTTHEGQ